MKAEAPAQPAPSLVALMKRFLLLGSTSFGGATFVYFYSDFVDRLRWLEHDEIINFRSMSQLLPGANMGDLAVLVGRRLGGLRGSIVALTSITAPGAVLMLLLSVLYFRGQHLPAVTSLFKGIGPAAAGLALANALEATGRELPRLRSAWIVPLTAVVVVFFRPPTLLVIVFIGALGILLYRPETPKAVRPGATEPR
jgi:chromate transporter